MADREDGPASPTCARERRAFAGPATIGDVAHRAGVSTATVSRVLSGAVPSRPQTRDRVLAAVGQLGYRPSRVARSLKLRRTQTIGAIVTDVENPYFAEVIRAVEDAARDLGYTLLLCNGAEDPEREAAYLEVLVEHRVDGVIVATSGVGQRHAGWLVTSPVPIVMMNSAAPVRGISAILSDNRLGGRLAAEHLLQLGHRRIGHITAPAANAAGAERWAGVQDALRAAGEGASAALVEGDGHVAGGERAMDELLARPAGVTGVVCYNDLTAIGALRSLRAHGRKVPREMSVIGFDDLDLAAYVDPPLTTIVQRKAEMGRWAVQHLAGMIGGRWPPPDTDPPAEVIRLPVHLLVRESTAPPMPERTDRDPSLTRGG